MINGLEADIYATLIGVIDENHRVPGVENAFMPGAYCARRYEEMLDHRQRIWDRLGIEDDEDVEGMIIALESIQVELCFRMFRLGLSIGERRTYSG